MSPPSLPAYGGVLACNCNTRIGTDGADNFDSSYYASYSQWINSGLLVNFVADNDSVYGLSRVAMPIQ